jgi:hypothetical protein
MNCAERKKVAWLCLSALLFLQLAIAAYACPTPKDGGMPTLAAVVTAAPPCPMTDQERQKLCEQHCVHSSQSVDTQPHSTVNAPVLSLLAVLVQPNFLLPTGPGTYGALLVTIVGPPPLVRFGVLRI